MDIEDEFICKFSNYLHICNDAKILPCGFTVCTACILNSIDKKGCLRCNLCKNNHRIESIDDLPKNKKMKSLIKQNYSQIFEVIFNKFQGCFLNLKNILDEDNNSFNNWFDCILIDVDIHFESLKQHLDKMRENIIDKIILSKRELSAELSVLRKDFKYYLADYESQIDQIKKITDTSKETLENYLLNCQNSIKSLEILKSKFNTVFEKISYEPNDWLPDESFICNFKYTEVNENKINFTVLTNMQPKVYDLNPYMEFPSGFCNLCNGEEIAVTDAAKNEILIFDKHFNSLKFRVRDIEGHSFNGPCKLAKDENFNTIYLGDFWNKRILVTNESFNKIKKVIDCTHLNIDSFYPIDFVIYKENIFVLDGLNKKVYKLSINKNFKLEEIVFIKDEKKVKFKDPVRVLIFLESIVVLDDFSKLYFFDFDGIQNHLIENNGVKISGVLIVNDLVSTITNDGNLIFYEKDEDKENFDLKIIFKHYYLNLANGDK
jgi:hypothetical protein